MPEGLNRSQFDTGVMPVGKFVQLETGQVYYIIAQARGIWMGAIARKRGLPKKFAFIPEVGIPFEVKGDDWEQLIVFDASQGQTPNLTSTNVVLQTSTSFQMGISAILGMGFQAAQSLHDQSITRMLELIAPIGGGTNQFLLNEIASGGADVTQTIAVTQGDLVSIDWAITQDTLGTSPHDSYITVVDAVGNKILYAIGAGNYTGSKTVRAEATGNLTMTAHNGDSVAHTFLCNVYRMVA